MTLRITLLSHVGIALWNLTHNVPGHYIIYTMLHFATKLAKIGGFPRLGKALAKIGEQEQIWESQEQEKNK